MKQRDSYLDFYRGIAAISVIFIHTTFHSGISYIPQIVRTISLLLDVPFFIFLAGWSAWYCHNPKQISINIFNIWKKWVFFIVLLNIILILLKTSHLDTLHDWMAALLFIRYSVNNLSIVGASNWYMPMYFTVLIAGIIFINLYNKFKCSLWVGLFLSSFFLIGLCYLSFSESYQNTIGFREGGYFGLSEYFYFYIVIFFIGYLSKEYRLRSLSVYICLCVVTIGLWFLCSRTYGIAARDLQGAKFPPHLMYFFASLPSIFTALYLKGRMKRIVQTKYILSIGRDALFYYFSQGLGASALYIILPNIKINVWYIKMIIALLINISISVCIAKLNIFLYKKWQYIYKTISLRHIILFDKYEA